jgi:hypothetical protein
MPVRMVRRIWGMRRQNLKRIIEESKSTVKCRLYGKYVNGEKGRTEEE